MGSGLLVSVWFWGLPYLGTEWFPLLCASLPVLDWALAAAWTGAGEAVLSITGAQQWAHTFCVRPLVWAAE